MQWHCWNLGVLLLDFTMHFICFINFNKIIFHLALHQYCYIKIQTRNQTIRDTVQYALQIINYKHSVWRISHWSFRLFDFFLSYCALDHLQVLPALHLLQGARPAAMDLFLVFKIDRTPWASPAYIGSNPWPAWQPHWAACPACYN